MSGQMDRREAMALLGLGVAASRLEAFGQHLHQIRNAPGQYRVQFFTPAEYGLVDTLAEMIIPADEVSPGAREAKVAAYIDLVVANSPEAVQGEWRSWLGALDGLAREQGGKAFADMGAGERAALVDRLARNEQKPASAAERLFAQMKRMTLFGYYSSEIGLRKDLGYQGNAALASFPGCPHPNQ